MLVAAAVVTYGNLPHKFTANGPPDEMTPHDLLADAWIQRGNIHVRGENVERLMQSLLEKAPAFAVHIQCRLLYNTEKNHVFTCPSCECEWTRGVCPEVNDLVEFMKSCKFGMMTTKAADSDKLASRCMALAATVNYIYLHTVTAMFTNVYFYRKPEDSIYFSTPTLSQARFTT